MKIATTLSSAVLVLALGAPARAETVLFTSPVNHREGKSIGCVIANVSSESLDVTIELVNEFGVTIVSSPATLAAGEIAKAYVHSGIGSGNAYCKFTVASDTGTNVRAGYCLADADDTACNASGDAR